MVAAGSEASSPTQRTRKYETRTKMVRPCKERRAFPSNAVAHPFARARLQGDTHTNTPTRGVTTIGARLQVRIAARTKQYQISVGECEGDRGIVVAQVVGAHEHTRATMVRGHSKWK